MEREPMTQEEIEGTVRAARDSVWVVNDEIAKLANNMPWNDERKGKIERNVAHLEIVMANPEISGSGLDLSDLTTAIAIGKQELTNRQ
jgi:hypothetical protein